MTSGPQFSPLSDSPKTPHFLVHQKVRLCAVDLEDQKVRLRAVWMGRNLGVKLGSFLEFDFGPQNCGAFLLRKSASKNALISIFFSYKEISVRKIALKPLVPVRLRAVLAILRIFAHFWPRFLR